jgi:hypothetical protein
VRRLAVKLGHLSAARARGSCKPSWKRRRCARSKAPGRGSRTRGG